MSKVLMMATEKQNEGEIQEFSDALDELLESGEVEIKFDERGVAKLYPTK